VHVASAGPHVSWAGLQSLVMDVYHGSQMDNPWDRRALRGTVNAFLSPAILEEGYQYASQTCVGLGLDTYPAPPKGHSTRASQEGTRTPRSGGSTPKRAASTLQARASHGSTKNRSNSRHGLKQIAVSLRNANLDPSQLLWIPPVGDVESYIEHVQDLPVRDLVANFGLHDNTEAQKNTNGLHYVTGLFEAMPEIATTIGVFSWDARQRGESNIDADAIRLKLDSTSWNNQIEGIKLMKAASEARKEIDQAAKQKGELNDGLGQMKALQLEIPPSISDSELEDALTLEEGVEALDPLQEFFQQECRRYNHLVCVLKNSMALVVKAIKGEIPFDDEIEGLYLDYSALRVPRQVASVAYPSLRPLGSWLADLKVRWQMRNIWLMEGPPPTFFLPGFFNPQGFVSAVLRLHAETVSAAGCRVDTTGLVMKCIFLKCSAEEVVEEAPMGAYVHGLHLDGARLDWSRGMLHDAFMGEATSPLPVLQLLPAASKERSKADYEAPLYQIATRSNAHVPGISPNFVMTLDLESQHEFSYWAMQGVACLCQVADE